MPMGTLFEMSALVYVERIVHAPALPPAHQGRACDQPRFVRGVIGASQALLIRLVFLIRSSMS
jgi:hypothetical protein